MRDPKYANSITANTKVESVNLNFMFIQSTRENKWREMWIYYSTFILFLNFIINVLIFVATPRFTYATERQDPPATLKRVFDISEKLEHAIDEMNATATAKRNAKRANHANGGRRRKTRTLNPHHRPNKTNKHSKTKSRRG